MSDIFLYMYIRDLLMWIQIVLGRKHKDAFIVGKEASKIPRFNATDFSTFHYNSSAMFWRK